MWEKIKKGIEVRTGLGELIKKKQHEYQVPKDTNIFYTLGIIALVAYMIQAVTGYFLLIYYIPHSDHAFRSIQDIMNTVPFGWLIRMVHIVVSSLMVIIILLHLISLFIMGSYKKPRELTWLAGGCLLLVVLMFCLSGYLLPWSQRSYWATTIATNMPTTFPVIGDFIAKGLRGGDYISGITLTRFFAIHVAFLPPLFLLLIGLHVFLVTRIGLSTPAFSKSAEDEKPWTEYRPVSHTNSYPFYPHFVLKEAFMITAFLAVTFFLISFMPTLFIPEAANTPADPFKTPAHIKPEWYFLAPYQMLKLIPNKFFGITLQLILVVILLLWPFFDTKKERNILKRPVLLSVFLLLLAMWIILTVWGRIS